MVGGMGNDGDGWVVVMIGWEERGWKKEIDG